jgi:4-diphosphocytidyl-2-C-methyl-D-erythritol kinase
VRTLELRAPAKVNLGLRITGVREDGYHCIDSVFAPLDLADGIVLRAASASVPRVEVSLSGETAAGLSSGPDNLAARAARAFLERAALGAEVSIALDKRIPAGAGLGGGSSDAGAVLRGLSALFPGGVGPEELAAVALGLGADVPFFLAPRPARVRGIGERIEPLAGLPGLPLLLAHPGISLATAQVYAAWDAHEGALTPPAPRPTMRPVFGPGLDASALRSLLENDLEPPAVRLCPAIARLHEQIGALGATAVGMSGSGAAVFGVFEDRLQAERALAKGRDEFEAAGVWARVAVTQPSPQDIEAAQDMDPVR